MGLENGNRDSNGSLQALEIDKLIWEINLGLTHESKIIRGWDSRLVIANGKIVFILDKGTGNKIDEIKWEPIANVVLLPNGDHIILISKNGDMISFSQSSGEQKEFDLPVRGLVKHTISYSGPTSKEPFEPLPAPGQTQPQPIFDPETSERISGGMRFDPETSEAIIENIKTQFDPETGEQIVVSEERQ